MDKILFNNVLPHVFENNEDITSEVWRKDVAFEKGNTYLVEADSGKGKSRGKVVFHRFLLLISLQK